MAFTSKLVFVVFMAVVVVFLVLMEHASDLGAGYGRIASQKIQNRKVLIGLERKGEASKKGVHGSSGSTNAGNDGDKMVDWELRKVPSGPDPLHHNGGGPKKPRTP